MVPACPRRGSRGSTEWIEEQILEGREQVRKFIGARFADEIVFTPNTTYAINLLASSFRGLDGAVVISDCEHNSNRLPWLTHRFIELDGRPDHEFPLEDLRRSLERNRVKLVSIASVSNVTGVRAPIREIASLAHQHGVPVHIDACQESQHQTINVVDDRADFVSFSLHKSYGPTGLGVLYARREHHERLHPEFIGGGAVEDNNGLSVVNAEMPDRLEYGLQNYSAQAAVAAAIEFLGQFKRSDIAAHFSSINAIAREQLRQIDGMRFIGPSDPALCGSICNFYIEDVDSLALAEVLETAGNVRLRAGTFCAHHYYHKYGLPPSIRISFGYSTTAQEVMNYARIMRHIIDRYLARQPVA